jgi:hypothetical protein
MKRLVFALVAVLVLSVGFISRAGATGNGAPSGPHFTLNIHGVAKGQGFNGNNQNDIFVPLYGKCTIQLNPGADFQVTQPDCVNNPPAAFTLPAPCAISVTTGLCTSTTTFYSVWARVLGKPGGSITITPCGTDATGLQVCSLNSYMAMRGTGKSKFTDQSGNLLFVTVCNTLTGKTSSIPLFSQLLSNYIWSVDNEGLRLAQLRFYQVPSAVPTSVNCP